RPYAGLAKVAKRYRGARNVFLDAVRDPLLHHRRSGAARRPRANRARRGRYDSGEPGPRNGFAQPPSRHRSPAAAAAGSARAMPSTTFAAAMARRGQRIGIWWTRTDWNAGINSAR